uniref:Putative movement protein 1 n=1 Tax=TGP Carmovirus 3 TaxID=944582 RepID=F2YS79_9TOMB|nr:putative movement protein 1 [TGP Carmovirus 3]
MDAQPTNQDLAKKDQTAKRGKTKNRLDVAHSGVSKGTSRDLVGANFVAVADTITYHVTLNF